MSKRAAEAAVGSAKKAKTAAITSFFKKDAVIQSSTPRSATKPDAAAPFDRAAWLAGLDDRARTLLALEIDTLDPSWLAVLHGELTKPYFLSLKEFLAKERRAKKVFPPEGDVYSWSRCTPFDSVRCVVLGQDPYHNDGQAHGLCFSVRPPVRPPPSLRNIYKCIKADYPAFRTPTHGSLVGWARSGVLLLNTCLTVEAHNANSHAGKGWEEFTQKVIDLVNERRKQGVVFLAWGSPAAKRCAKVDKTRHLLLNSVHPSPLSAARGFFDCKHFIKANDWLEQKYGIEGQIDWDSLADTDGSDAGGAGQKSTPGNKSTPSKQPASSAQQTGLEDDLGQVGKQDVSKTAERLAKVEDKASKEADGDDFGVSAEEEEAMAESLAQATSSQPAPSSQPAQADSASKQEEAGAIPGQAQREGQQK